MISRPLCIQFLTPQRPPTARPRLTPSAGTAPQPEAPPSLTGPAVTVLVEGANVRAGPGTDFPVVSGLLYQNDRAALLGRSQAGDWLHVRLPDTGESSAGSSPRLSRPACPSPSSFCCLPVVDPPVPAPDP